MYSSFNSSAGDSTKDSAPHRSVNSVREQHQTNTTNTNASNSPTTSFCPSENTSTSIDSTYFDSKDTINSSLNNPSPFPSFQSILTSDARARKGGLGFHVSYNKLLIIF